MTEDSKFGSRYQNLEMIGSGGMGAVYRAYDATLDMPVAVKVLLPGKSDEAAVRFHNEARAAAKLMHPNIIKVYDFGQNESGDLYLVMEYIDGITLEQYIKQNGSLDFVKAYPIFLQICKGLGHAHKHGVLHRDVKPSNVILRDNNEQGHHVYIADFGLAKLAEVDGSGASQSLTSTGVRVGSPLYMSPEQALSLELDQRTDIYSFGCLIYKTLTGRPPLEGSTYIETLSMHINESAPALAHKFAGDYPDELISMESLVAKCLSKDKEQRYASMEDLQNELQEVAASIALTSKSLDSEAETTEKGSLADRMYLEPGPQKNSGLKLLATALIILAVGAVATYVMLKVNEPPPKVLKTEDIKVDTSNLEEKSNELSDISSAFGENGITPPKSFVVLSSQDARAMQAWAKKGSQVPAILSDGYKLSSSDIDNIVALKPNWILLSRAGVTDDDLKKLCTCESLHTLKLSFCPDVSAAGLTALTKLPHLEDLSLRGCAIDDTKMKLLEGLKNLKRLDLEYNHDLTYKGLMALTKMKGLRSVAVYNTGVKLTGDQLEKAKRKIGIQNLYLRTTYDTPRAYQYLDTLRASSKGGVSYGQTGPVTFDVRKMHSGFLSSGN
ncbi:MAG TPA: protein kinase [Candidatus Melainabacteria bacterium]|nr:protein kinase [Candidatus Melainabacteria bacterium]